MTHIDRGTGFIDATALGFLPDVDGAHNQKALQQAVDCGGTVIVSRPGVYDLSGTVYMGSDTSLVFGAGTFVRKVDLNGPFSHVLLNKGALTKTWDHRISVDGLHVIVNGLDVRTFADVFGLHGQLSFFYAKDIKITRFRCMDLGRWQYGIHVCTFEDLIVDDVIIDGNKDGVHLGRGCRFTIRNGIFRTFDDAIALNAHDYDVGNPELGWIENGLVESCHDLDQENTTGFFCRILAGAWPDWQESMELQKSDTVVHAGRLYRVRADPDERIYRSLTPPTHATGHAVLDGITWVAVQDDVIHTCGVRNVTFRDIWLHKPRIGFSVHFDHDKYSRSYYPGSPIPRQENLIIENCTVLHEGTSDFLRINTPIDTVQVTRSRFRRGRISLGGVVLPEQGTTHIRLSDCTFVTSGPTEVLANHLPGRRVIFHTSGSTVTGADFHATVSSADGASTLVRSDLPGLVAP